MHALEFLLNGKRVCIAAPGDDGLVMSSIAMTGALETPDTGVVHFSVGGVRDEQHLDWIRRSLSIGDTVEIRVVDAANSDPPASIEPVTDAQRERLRIISDDNAAS